MIVNWNGFAIIGVVGACQFCDSTQTRDIHCVVEGTISSLLRVLLDDTSAFDWSLLVDNV